MSQLPGDGGPYVIVTWEPMLHVLKGTTHSLFILDHYKLHVTARTECGLVVHGMIDDTSKHTVTCLTCLVGVAWR